MIFFFLFFFWSGQTLGYIFFWSTSGEVPAHTEALHGHPGSGSRWQLLWSAQKPGIWLFRELSIFVDEPNEILWEQNQSLAETPEYWSWCPLTGSGCLAIWNDHTKWASCYSFRVLVSIGNPCTHMINHTFKMCALWKLTATQQKQSFQLSPYNKLKLYP